MYKICRYIEPPGAPGEPSIVDFDNKSVTLRWAKPKEDGGRPISHYIILLFSCTLEHALLFSFLIWIRVRARTILCFSENSL